MRTVFWSEMFRHEFEEALTRDPVVVVPVGSIEQHGPHCAVVLDLAIPMAVCEAAARQVTEFPVIVAPPVVFGLTHYNMGFPGTISLRAETFLHVLLDVCRSIWANGFRRIVLLNGHGGNQQLIRTAAVILSEEDIWVTAFSHWDMVPGELAAWSERDNGSIGHGGEWETSLLMHVRPAAVDMGRAAADVAKLKLPGVPFAAFPERRRETPSGTMGDPHVASPEKGERLFNVEVERLAECVRVYHSEPVRGYREFGTHCP